MNIVSFREMFFIQEFLKNIHITYNPNEKNPANPVKFVLNLSKYLNS